MCYGYLAVGPERASLDWLVFYYSYETMISPFFFFLLPSHAEQFLSILKSFQEHIAL